VTHTFLGLPGEIVVNIGFEIKIRSGLENLFIIALCNDAIVMFATAKTYEEGGYQPGTATLLAKGSGEIIIEEALNLLNRIGQKE